MFPGRISSRAPFTCLIGLILTSLPASRAHRTRHRLNLFRSMSSHFVSQSLLLPQVPAHPKPRQTSPPVARRYSSR